MVNHNDAHFDGWATKVNIKCSDGRIIMPDAFKHHDGQTVPLVWGHCHNDPSRVLGHALLEHRDEGVYAYGYFNNTEQGQNAKMLVENGDVLALSIYANQLKQRGSYVEHGMIREVSIVLAGANPGASIQNVIKHSDDGSDPIVLEDEAVIYHGEEAMLVHSEEEVAEEDAQTEEKENDEMPEEIAHSEEGEKKEESEETIADILNTLTEKQKIAVSYVVGEALEAAESDEHDETDNDKEEKEMKHNAFETEETVQGGVLTHADQQAIINLAKSNGGNSLQHAIETYVSNSETLSHGFVNEDGENAIDTLFPEYKDVKPGAPELVERDLGWVGSVMKGVHKSPISRIRTRSADARAAELRAKGYTNRENEKTISGNIKLVSRTTDPQTVYRKDQMHRDDIIDITDFDVVEYQYTVMRHNLEEDLALAIMIGDGREEGDADKISEEHIRPIWKDDDLYTIHQDVDIEAARAELQGTETGAHFGENYIYAEAIITAALYAREKYKGKGNLEFYCDPHILNVMLLARDLNGRRIYSSKADLAAALNVKTIHTAEQFAGKTRTTKDGKTKKLLGLFVNLNDYHVGATKGGEITRFSDFDIDFNSYKYLIETRLSGAMVNLYSAIALEEPVNGAAG